MIVKAPNWECTHHNINTALFATTTPTTASKNKSRCENTNTSQCMTRASRKKQASNTREMRSSEACFSLFDILLFGFHFIDLSNFRISSDLRLAVLQGLGKDLRGWNVEIGVSS